MSRFRYTSRAEADLDEITDYSAERNPDAGLRFLEAVEARCRLIARFPRTGTRRENLGPGVRSVVVKGYLVFFRDTADGIDVLLVLHGARDIGPEQFDD
jgi:toxin ParE1/3/4